MMQRIGPFADSTYWCPTCHVVQRGPSTGDFECISCARHTELAQALMRIAEKHLSLITQLTEGVAKVVDAVTKGRTP